MKVLHSVKNIGNGAGLYNAKRGTNIQLKSLLGGNGVSITENDDTITIGVTGQGEGTPEITGVFGEVNTASNLGDGSGIYERKEGVDLQFKSILAGTDINLCGSTWRQIKINAETATGENLGSGSGIYHSKYGTALRFKSLVWGSGVYISADSSTITISASGDVNTATNLGTGSGLFASKADYALQFKSIAAGSNIELEDDGSTITINASGGAAGEANTASNLGSGIGVYSGKISEDLRFKSLLGVSGIYLSTDSNHIRIGMPTLNSGALDTTAILASGAGTTNYVTKWSNTNGKLVDSIIFDNGANVGINENSPTEAGWGTSNTTVLQISDTGAAELVLDANARFYFRGGVSAGRIGSVNNYPVVFDINKSPVGKMHTNGGLSWGANVQSTTPPPNGFLLESGLIINTITTGSSNDVIVYDKDGLLEGREINSDVWDTSVTFSTDAERDALSGWLRTLDSAILTSANSYTDFEIDTLSGYLVGYIDDQDAATLSSANSYTDTEITTLSGHLVGYIDNVSGHLSNYIDSELTTHSSNADAHHNESHTLWSHSDTGATIHTYDVPVWLGSYWGALAVDHSWLASVGADDHHNQQHSFDGSDHTFAGLTAGQLFIARAATVADWRTPSSSAGLDLSFTSDTLNIGSTSDTPRFARLGLGTAADGTASLKLNNIPAYASSAGLVLISDAGVVKSRTPTQLLEDAKISSAVDTISGWSSLTTEQIYFHKIGKMVYITYAIDGTGNNDDTLFELPYDTNFVGAVTPPAAAIGSAYNVCPRLRNTANHCCYFDSGATAGVYNWGNGVSKCLCGQFWYETSA